MSDLSDEQRARLVEVMARSICWVLCEDPDALDNNVADALFLPNWTKHKTEVIEAIAAAEAAGFRIEWPG